MYGSFFITYFVDLMIFIFKIFEDDSLGAEKRGTLAHVSNSVSKSFKLYLLFTKECLSFFFSVFFPASLHFHTKWHGGLWRSFQFWIYHEVTKCILFVLILIFSL